MPFFCKCLIKSCYGPKVFFCEVVSFSRCRNYLERVDQIKNWLMIQQLQLFQCLQLVFRDLRLSWSLKGEKSLLTFHWKCWPEKRLGNQQIICTEQIGHWNILHLKVSQGGARGARTNFFQLDCQKLERLIWIIISMILWSFIDFEASFVIIIQK